MPRQSHRLVTWYGRLAHGFDLEVIKSVFAMLYLTGIEALAAQTRSSSQHTNAHGASSWVKV